jgi:hypothetical protein
MSAMAPICTDAETASAAAAGEGSGDGANLNTETDGPEKSNAVERKASMKDVAGNNSDREGKGLRMRCDKERKKDL